MIISGQHESCPWYDTYHNNLLNKTAKLKAFEKKNGKTKITKAENNERRV
jgi:hypothetical protein